MADIETDIRSELLGPELRRGVFGAELFLRSEELDLNKYLVEMIELSMTSCSEHPRRVHKRTEFLQNNLRIKFYVASLIEVDGYGYLIPVPVKVKLTIDSGSCPLVMLGQSFIRSVQKDY